MPQSPRRQAVSDADFPVTSTGTDAHAGSGGGYGRAGPGRPGMAVCASVAPAGMEYAGGMDEDDPRDGQDDDRRSGAVVVVLLVCVLGGLGVWIGLLLWLAG